MSAKLEYLDLSNRYEDLNMSDCEITNINRESIKVCKNGLEVSIFTDGEFYKIVDNMGYKSHSISVGRFISQLREYFK